MLSLFTPSKVDVYKMAAGAYMGINGRVPVCVKPQMDKPTGALEDVSRDALLGMLTSSDVVCGQFAGDETMSGKAVKHYMMDGDAAGGYPAAFEGDYSEACEPPKFEGDFGADIQVTDVDKGTAANLPAARKNPIAK